ncbi:nucleotide-binding oligomerization domain-containing protein [Striga asiatica]|uniref:Nucleotide-binding oligomerization domain-containing protein n=1 Tax=Striga asiatica TaxID=4170 RepID=A0A5A7PJP8_STRAF|nr:nucleotide-binding oligomerization domain-containing protein [Striga asiatica]
MSTVDELQWALQAIESKSLETISFHLSQPTSASASASCHQQTDENSLKLHISTQQFSHLLNAITNSQNTRIIRHLEFHSVEWDPQSAKNLAILLQTAEHLTFQQNKFDAECLSQLSRALTNNKSVKHIAFFKSGLGPNGASALARALKDNQTLEGFQIREDSIGKNGAEDLSQMLEANSTLKCLTVFDPNPAVSAPLISAVLARNRATEVCIWNEGNSSKTAEFEPEKGSLRVRGHLDVAGACRVTCALGRNSTVRCLDMSGLRLKSRWAREFRWVLEQNTTLREVNLSRTGLKDKGVVYVAAGLFRNRALEKLYLDGNSYSGVGVEHLLCPLSKFSALQNQANTVLKRLSFGGGRTKIGRVGLAAILHFLSSNQSMDWLGIHDDGSLKPYAIVKILESLKRNSTLRCLSLQGCKGVKGEQVYRAIMETLDVNPWIEEIDLSRTPLEAEGKMEDIIQRLKQNETSGPGEIDLLNDMAMTMSRSCRVFLCGQECAGKTTLFNSILQNVSPSRVPYMGHVRSLVDPIEQAVKLPGMSIKNFKDEDTRISIWNLAGQHESFSLHDLMFPGHGCSSFFLIVCSMLKKPGNRELKTLTEIEEDLNYWLRFIVSTSRRAVQQCTLPSVTIVLTHHDKVDQQPDDFQNTVNMVQRLKDKFEGLVAFCSTVFTVDARSSGSVSKLSQHISRTCKTILEKIPRVYQLCIDLVEILSEWRRENNDRPSMKWKEFSELCQVKVPCLRIQSRHDNRERVETRRKAVATSLHELGEVIYFDELEYVILDCGWFYGEMLSQMLRIDFKKHVPKENNGFVSREEFEKILRGSLQSCSMMENLDANGLIKMMLRLGLCFEQENSSDLGSALLVPSSLEDGRWKPQRWLVDSADSNYVGRRLQCDESSHVFLTPGFFPRLQASLVLLHNKITKLREQHGAASYTLEKHLISITINGIHVRMEPGGQSRHYIDVLACSSKSPTEMLRLFQHFITPSIQQTLFHGPTLTEHVIRPQCVKNLTPPRHRQNHTIPVQQLKLALLSLPADNIYDYQHTWRDGFDFARDLLSDDDFRDVLHSRYHDLYNLAVELQVPPQENGEIVEASVDPTLGGIAKGVEAVLQRLTIIEQEIRDMKREIQGLRYHEQRLLGELHRKVGYLVNYSVQQEERKVPNMLYFARTDNYSRRLVTSVVPGMKAMRLHMLCEFRGEMHVIEDQVGCEVMRVDNEAVRCLAPYVKGFMRLVTFALKIGAHLAVGMGEMIPDLEELGTAQQWLLDFLRDQGCSTGRDIAEKFGLWRVRYRDDGRIAWVCRRHMHARAYQIVEAPI